MSDIRLTLSVMTLQNGKSDDSDRIAKIGLHKCHIFLVKWLPSVKFFWWSGYPVSIFFGEVVTRWVSDNFEWIPLSLYRLHFFLRQYNAYASIVLCLFFYLLLRKFLKTKTKKSLSYLTWGWWLLRHTILKLWDNNQTRLS